MLRDSTLAEIKKLKGPIVVFGAGGFVGANLFRTLLLEREDCYAVTHQPFIPWRLIGINPYQILHCDITDGEQVARLFSAHNFKTIFCFAAYGAYERQRDSDLIFQTNVLGLNHIVDAASRHGFSALVHAGSSSEYGFNSKAPKENDPLLPNSHYAVSKVSANYLLQFVARKLSLPVINLRYYSLYGPWEEQDRLIPRLIKNGLKGELPPFVAPEISRDFLYIDDAIEATVLAATRAVDKIAGEPLNIATGRQTTIREVAAVAKEIFQIKQEPEWSSMQNRKWDLDNWYGDPSLAKKLLGWEAQTSLKDGLLQTIEWTRSNQHIPEVTSVLPLQKTVRLSAVIACYKDMQAIPVMYDRLSQVFHQLKVDYEIIFVNDASPDQTGNILQNICDQDEHVIAIEHSRNFGSQSAFLSGMSISTGDAVALLDGDLQDPPEVISDFYRHWLEGYEVIYGRRTGRQMGQFTNFFYRFFYRLFRWMAYIPIPVDAGDFSLMDRKVVNELLALPETDQFLRGLRAWVGFKQTSVDYFRPDRMFGRSTNNWIRNIGWARKGIFSFSFMPLDFLLVTGVFLTLLAFVGLVFQLWYRLSHRIVPPGFTTVIVLILFFGGVELLGMAILGEYLGKVLEEAKHRPKYIRKSIRAGKKFLSTASEIQDFLKQRFGISER